MLKRKNLIMKDNKILNNIINQLNTDKTELAKVNLALVDDIDKRLNSIKELELDSVPTSSPTIEKITGYLKKYNWDVEISLEDVSPRLLLPETFDAVIPMTTVVVEDGTTYTGVVVTPTLAFVFNLKVFAIRLS